MSNALQVIEAWCCSADARKLSAHRIAFWIVRDCLEGKLHPSRAQAEAAAQFVRQNVNPCPDKKAVLEALEKYITEAKE